MSDDLDPPAERGAEGDDEGSTAFSIRLPPLPSASEIWGSVTGVRERPPLDDLYRRDLEQDIELKEQYASNIARLLVGQVVVTNLVFVVYAWAGMKWRVPENVMIAWISSTWSSSSGSRPS